VWGEGDNGSRGARPHAEVELWKGPATAAARRQRATGDGPAAAVVETADRARRSLDDEAFYRDSQLLLERSYLRAGTPRGGSGFGGHGGRLAGPARPSVPGHQPERDLPGRGLRQRPPDRVDGRLVCRARRAPGAVRVDLSAGLVAEARRRLPRWADRFWSATR
jgi:hypothetical protein